jgi:hypothetical protein
VVEGAITDNGNSSKCGLISTLNGGGSRTCNSKSIIVGFFGGRLMTFGVTKLNTPVDPFSLGRMASIEQALNVIILLFKIGLHRRD